MEENKESFVGYYRIRRGTRQDPEAVYRALQKGYGTKHPERINGYPGLFFGTGDVFVSEAVGSYMSNGDFREFVFDSLKLFEKEKYGEISEGDEMENAENRWFGNGDKVFGRYGFFRDKRSQEKEQYDEVIRIRKWKGNTWITYDSEMDLFLLLKDNGEAPGTVMEGLPRGDDGTE